MQLVQWGCQNTRIASVIFSVFKCCRVFHYLSDSHSEVNFFWDSCGFEFFIKDQNFLIPQIHFKANKYTYPTPIEEILPQFAP